MCNNYDDEQWLIRRLKVLREQYGGTRWVDLFGGEWAEGDEAYVRQDRERLDRLAAEFKTEFGKTVDDVIYGDYGWTKLEYPLFRDGPKRIVYESVKGNKCCRIMLEGKDKRSMCSVTYSVRHNRSWAMFEDMFTDCVRYKVAERAAEKWLNEKDE